MYSAFYPPREINKPPSQALSPLPVPSLQPHGVSYKSVECYNFHIGIFIITARLPMQYHDVGYNVYIAHP